jgi:hypothetical protein
LQTVAEMKWLPLVFCVGCAAQDASPISSKVTLDDQTWAATAVSFDELGPVDVEITISRDVDRAECSWTGLQEVDLSLPLGDRTTPHVVAPIDLATPNSGQVVYSDEAQDPSVAVAGNVTPALTTWAYSAAEGHNVIVQIDGTFDVVLADGHALTGAFSATPCQGK